MRLHSVLPPILLAASYFTYSLFLTSRGHFHEDVYILLAYVENLIAGHGICYYPGGPPTEGVTDFLALLILAALGKLGVNAGIATIFLNALGVWIISHLLLREIVRRKELPRGLQATLLPLIFLWPYPQQAKAALFGFPVFLYLAVTLCAFASLVQGRRLLRVPVLGLLLALMRPDGVLIGVPMTLLGLKEVSPGTARKRYLAAAGIAALLGIGYFAWRYAYFGQLLPLPLYVKSHGTGLPGMMTNGHWILRSLHVLLPLALLATLNRAWTRYAVLALPFLVLLGALASAEQSQNMGFRFQGPAFIAAYYLLVRSIVDFLATKRRTTAAYTLVALYVVTLFANNARWWIVSYTPHTRHAYVNQFAPDLHRTLPSGSTIALTEAGRLAYWNTQGHRVVDLVGLNTVFTARNTVSPEYIESLRPDVVMYHEASTFEHHQIDLPTGVHVLEIGEDRRHLLALSEPFAERNLGKLSKVQAAAVAATQFLHQHRDEYDLFRVDYGGRFSHVYGFRRELGLTESLAHSLNASFEERNGGSYLDMAGTRARERLEVSGHTTRTP